MSKNSGGNNIEPTVAGMLSKSGTMKTEAPLKAEPFTDDWRNTAYDTIVDVRSPAEFAEDHIPGAINLPVLSDEERALVGKIYKEVSPFQARITGASLISQNIGHHIQHTLIDKPGEWKALLYCWRGGLRSRSFHEVLSRIGWRVDVLKGGYKHYRRVLIAELNQQLIQLNPVIVQGATGTGKTRMIKAWVESGEQAIDLEGLADHKGSVLGGNPNREQPTQKGFESALFQTLSTLDLQQPVLLEAESSKVGDIHLPTLLWKKMKQAPQIEITLRKSERVALLLEEYEHWLKNPEGLKKKLTPLRFRLGQKTIESWIELIDGGHWSTLVETLLETHYDAAYETAASRREGTLVGPVEIPDKDQHGTPSVLTAMSRLVNEVVTGHSN